MAMAFDRKFLIRTTQEYPLFAPITWQPLRENR